MKIDIHTHILPRTVPDYHKEFGYGEWIVLHHTDDGVSNKSEMRFSDGRHFRTVTANSFDADVRIEEMNSTGVDVQVLSTVPVMFSYWAKPSHCLEICRYLNDDLATTVMKYPTRFVGLGSIPMHDPELAIQELKRMKYDLHLSGIQIGSHVNELHLGYKTFHPIYKTCQDLDLPIFVHPWDMPKGGHWEPYWQRWLVGMPAETAASIASLSMSGVFQQFPQLRICFAHGGGSYPFTIGRISHGYKCRPDLCAQDCNEPPETFLGQFYVDSLVHDVNALEYNIRILGESKICLGSDYPFPLGEAVPGQIISEAPQFLSDVKEKLLYKNALQFLGRDNVPLIAQYL
jgi:aminocarboxymuconate-semialdehyde decarboxylase